MTAPAHLVDVLPSALALLGLPGVEDRLGLGERVGEVSGVAVLLVDGLGHRLLPAAAPQAPLLADALAGRVGSLDELACGFPSTTPTSLVSLGTGALPGEHGILGFTLAVPGTDRVLTHIDWRDDPDPRQWQPVPSLFDRAARAGISTAVVTRGAFAGSGLTVAAYGSARIVAAERPDDLAVRMLAELHAGTELVYGYHSALDTAAHVHGIDSPQWRAAAAAVDQLITRLAESLPAGAALIVTADHGGFDVPAEGRFDVGTDPRLSDGVRVLAGEPRVRYVHVREGALPDVLAAWREVLGEAAHVMTRDEAVATGWFGPVHPAHLPRIGDIVAVCREHAVVMATGYEPDAVHALVGFHGGLTPEETAIPLLVLTGRG